MKRILVKKAIILTLAAFLGLAPTAAKASNKVSSPDVERGQLEFEYRGGYDWDDTAKKDRQEVNKFIVNYGFSDRFRMETKIDSGGPDDNQDWTMLELSARYQLFKEDEAWARLSLEETY